MAEDKQENKPTDDAAKSGAQDAPSGNTQNASPDGTLGAQSGGTQDAQSDAPQTAVLAQYVKDLSFENPKAAQTLQALSRGEIKPKIEISINVGGNRLADEAYEVELKINATSKNGDETLFAVELVYAGLFGARNLAPEVMEGFLLVQAPHMLFPFARRIIADTTRDGGFAPLMLEPIDFAALYQQQRQRAETQAQEDAPKVTAEIGTIDLGETKGSA